MASEDDTQVVGELVNALETTKLSGKSDNDYTTSESDSESDYQLQDDNNDDDETEAHNFASTIINEINQGFYTCLVCTSEIDSSSKIWSCHFCSRVFDLSCIKDWAKRGSSTDSSNSWRCPSCNGTHNKLPKHYTCWCGKLINPQINEFVAHSCGQTCNKPLKNCIHSCSLECHPGPHIEKCTALGPIMKCKCGKEEQQLPCVLTDYKNGWLCNNVCDDLLPCGIHKCKSTCHGGLCGECNEVVKSKCYCGKHELDLKCHERNLKKCLSVEDGEEFIGSFQCDEICNELLDCGNHRCTELCHSKIDSNLIHKCLLSPNNLKYCPCGETKIENQRNSCLDPIKTCDNICNKKLPCGHRCYWKCHEGECSPCYQTIEVRCKCHYTMYSIACKLHETGYNPTCNHKCQALKNCRRHRCLELCCEYEPIATTRERERQKAIRHNLINKHSVNNEDQMTIEARHICTKECNKLLPCGKHYCNMTCHAGPCNPCLESSSEDLVCHCGKTVLPAPVRCGSKLPPCPNQCQRTPSCGHRAELHHCHPDDKKCPNCTFLLTKTCQCDKKLEVKNVMCYQQNISCGVVCNKTLKCGTHKCTKTCHPEGQCQSKCLQICSMKRSCGHECKQTCHLPFRCKESIPCKEMVTLQCKCKRLSKQIVCTFLQKSKSEIPMVLECDSECQREERNRLLFEAFKIEKNKEESLMTEDLITKYAIIENIYTPYVLSIFQQQKVWASSIETIFNRLINGSLGRQSYHFQPMKSIQRRFIRELADSYKLASESQDQEPKRSVFIKLQSNITKVPQLDLANATMIIEKYKLHESMKNKKQKLINELKSKDTNEGDRYFNSIVIRDIFFGVTIDEITVELLDILDNDTKLDPVVKAVSNTEFVFYFNESSKVNTRVNENYLNELAKVFAINLSKKNLAYTCLLSKIDSDANVIYEVKKLFNSVDEDSGDDVASELVSGESSDNETDEQIQETIVKEEENYDWY